MSVQFEIPLVTDPAKHLTDSTKKQYGRHLNHLAKRGFPNVEAIKKDIFGVIAAIKDLAPSDSEEDRAKRRFYLSTIFWVIPELKTQSANPFKLLWEESLPAVNFKTGRAWQTRKDYTPPAV